MRSKTLNRTKPFLDKFILKVFFIIVILNIDITLLSAQGTFEVGDTTVSYSFLRTDVEKPWEILWGPDDMIWFTERDAGNVCRVDPYDSSSPKEILLTLPSNQIQQGPGTGGLLGMVIHPDFNDGSPHVYLAHSNIQNLQTLSRYTYNFTNQRLENQEILLQSTLGPDNHGSRLLISNDQKLLMTTGANDEEYASRLDNIVGKVLRINLDGSAPIDNPFYDSGNPTSPASYIYSYGHRNPQGIAQVPADHPTYPNAIYALEHGAQLNDEFNRIEPGNSYGWGFLDINDNIVYEGYCDPSSNTNENTCPLVTFDLAPTGLLYYDHSAIPEWEGTFIGGSSKGARIFRILMSSDGLSVINKDTSLNPANNIVLTNDDQYVVWGDDGTQVSPRDYCISPNGEVFMASHNQDRIVVLRNENYCLSAPTIENPDPLCSSDPIPVLTASGSGTIRWYSDTGLTNLLHTGEQFEPTDITETTTYYLTQSNTDCTSAYSSVTITILSDPQPFSIDQSASIQLCSGDTLSFSLNGSEIGATYQTLLDNVSIGDVVEGTGSLITLNTIGGLSSGNIQVRSSLNNCTSIMNGSFDIEISDPFNVVLQAVDDQLQATPSVSPGGLTFSWYRDQELIDGDDPVLQLSRSGTYYVIVDNGSCNVISNTIVFTCASVPEMPEEYSVCFDSFIQLEAVGENITWYSDPDLENIIATGNILNTDISTTTTFYATQTSEGCQSNPGTVTITVTGQLNAFDLSGNTSMCSGEDVTIQLSDSENGIEYVVLINTTEIGISAMGSGESLSIDIPYYHIRNDDVVTVRAMNEGCDRLMNGSIVINHSNVVNVYFVDEDQTLIATSGIGYLYQWTLNNTPIAGETGNSIDIQSNIEDYGLLVTVAGCTQLAELTDDQNLLTQNISIGDTRGYVRLLTNDIEVPWSIELDSNGFLWVTDRDLGVVSKINRNTGDKQEVLRLGETQGFDANTSPRGGLLGLTLSNEELFVAYTYNDGNLKLRIAKYTIVDGDLTNETVLLENIPSPSMHGCDLLLSSDGFLYITTASPNNNAQDINSLEGKVLRINTDGSMPVDNPIPGSSVFTTGHRNPQGITQAGSYIYISEHGEVGGDEINLINSGNNYGWPDVTTPCNNPDIDCSFIDLGSVAPAGLDYYDHTAFPQLNNSLLIATLRGQSVIKIPLDNALLPMQNIEHLFGGNEQGVFGRIRDIHISEEGTIFIAYSGNTTVEAGIAEISPIRSSDNENVEGLSAVLFPNPARDNVDVLVPGYTSFMVRVFDVNGKLIATSRILDSNTTTINILNYSRGLYFVKINVEDDEQTYKIIKD